MRHDPRDLPDRELEIVACPECDAPAEVSWRSRFDPGTTTGTDLAYVRCLLRHWFLMPLDRAAAG